MSAFEYVAAGWASLNVLAVVAGALVGYRRAHRGLLGAFMLDASVEVPGVRVSYLQQRQNRPALTPRLHSGIRPGVDDDRLLPRSSSRAMRVGIAATSAPARGTRRPSTW